MERRSVCAIMEKEYLTKQKLNINLVLMYSPDSPPHRIVRELQAPGLRNNYLALLRGSFRAAIVTFALLSGCAEPHIPAPDHSPRDPSSIVPQAQLPTSPRFQEFRGKFLQWNQAVKAGQIEAVLEEIKAFESDPKSKDMTLREKEMVRAKIAILERKFGKTIV